MPGSSSAAPSYPVAWRSASAAAYVWVNYGRTLLADSRSSGKGLFLYEPL